MVMQVTHPIPNEVFIPACNATLRQYAGHCCDKWGEEEAAFCRKQCPPQFQFVETDWIRQRAVTLRKAGKLDAVNGGTKRKKKPTPNGRYAEYLKTEHWQCFRVKVLEFWQWQCCLCKGKASEVHHNTYMRLGQERLTDCVAICSKCHTRVHSLLPDGNDALELEDDSSLFADQ